MVLKEIDAMQLIVALDFNNQADAMKLVDELDPNQCSLKVGSELFTYCGANLVRNLVAKQFKVFLDLKFHDIPNTVAKACIACADMGVWMLTIHAAGGFAMMHAAKEALAGKDAPLLMAVTVLTSQNENELSTVGIHQSLDNQVDLLANLARLAGMDGVICSAHEVSRIKALHGSDFLAATPGIRLENAERNDQVRSMTPAQALSAGSDYIIVGRPITKAKHPVTMVRTILDTIKSTRP